MDSDIAPVQTSSAGPGGYRSAASKWVWIGLASLLFAAGLWAYAVHQHEEFFDSALASKANGICLSTKAELRTVSPLPPSPSFEERARQVERLNGSLTRMVRRLRSLEQPGANATFDRWLDDWHEFIAVGANYAEAIRSGDPAIYEPAGNRADPISIELNRITRANNMTDCIF